MDVSAQVSMKGAAKCDMHCDLQNSVNQLGSECTLRCWDSLSSKPASVSLSTSATPPECHCVPRPAMCLAL